MDVKEASMTSSSRMMDSASAIPSGLGSPVTSSNNCSGTMSRLELPKKQLVVAERKFLPQGDVLPMWYNMSLVQKLPMFPAPSGAVDLTLNKMCTPAFVNKERMEFDLSDPYNHCISTSYNALTDPHLGHYLNIPRVKKRLQKNGELTPDGKVRCKVAEFNRYRKWLKHIGLLEFKKQQEQEREKVQKMKNLRPGDNLEIAIIELQIHQEEVRQRQIKTDEAKQIKMREQMLGLEKKHEEAKQRLEEKRSPDNEHNQEKNAHRQFVYTRATSLQRKRHKQHLKSYKNKLRAHLEHLKEVEAKKQDGTAQRILEGWTRHKEFQRQWEADVKKSFENEEDRSLRYRKLFDAEMNRRWQKQAGRIKYLKDEAREVQNEREETYSRNLAKAFASSPVFNPEGYKTVRTLKEKGEGDARGEEEDEAEMLTEEEEKDAMDTVPESGQELKSRDTTEEDRVPLLKTVHTKKSGSRGGSLAMEKPLETMHVNVRLHDIKDNRSMEDVQKMKRAISEVKSQVSGESISRMPGLKRKPEPPPKPPTLRYPTKTRPMTDHDNYTGDEVCIYTPRELIVQNMSDDEEECETPPDGLFDVDELARASMCEGLSAEERKRMEELLARLLSELNQGHLDQEDLIRLASICAALTESQLIEQATSTTSLEYVPPGPVSRESTVVTRESSLSTVSSGLGKYLEETLERANQEKDQMEEFFGTTFVEDTIRNTIAQLAQDLQDGTLSREDVREIGSAVASVIMGEIRSDHSVIAEEVVVPTLQRLLRDAEEIDEVLLDQTMASLLSTYNQVTRRHDKMVWQVLKDFVVELLLRTKSGMIKGVVDVPYFLDLMEKCKETPLHFELELPCEHEIIMVLTQAITKLSGVHKLSPVLCELMKIILDTGQAILVARHGADKLSLPRIDTAMLEQVGESACGLEVALEVAATVSDGLYRDMLIEAKFESYLQEALAPNFAFVLLACWGEMVAGVPKESIGMQTSSKEIAFTTTVAENLILLTFNMMWLDANTNRLPSSVITHLALHVAEFPALMPLASVFEHDEQGKIKLPIFVMRKIAKLGQNIQEGSLGYDEAKKLVAVVLHIYIREVLLQADSALPPVSLEDESGVRANVSFLVTNVTRKVLDNVQDRVTRDAETGTAVGVSLVTGVLQTMSDEGERNVKDTAQEGLRPSEKGESQLKDIIKATTCTDQICKDEMAIPLDVQAYLSRVTNSVKAHHIKYGTEKPKTVEGEQQRPVSDIIRKELCRMAKDVTYMFTGMAVLHQQHSKEPCPLVNKMINFLVSILLELRSALDQKVLSTTHTCEFLRAVACELLPPEARPNPKELEQIIMNIVQDIEWRKDKSIYFGRLVRKLSKLSLDSGPREEVAEGMAATAHMLSSVDPNILNQFIQTTLLSLLNSIRQVPRSATAISAATKAAVEIPPDSTSNRRPTPQSSAAIERASKPAVCHPVTEDTAKTKGDGVDQDVKNKFGAAEEQKVPRSNSRSGSSSASDTRIENEMEISHETNLIARIIIQNTLERLGADFLPTLAERLQTPDVFEQLVKDFNSVAVKRKPVPSKHFSHLEPAMASYAQELLEHVNKHMDENEECEDEQVQVMSTDSIATIIINNTFRSIDDGLNSGRLLCPITTGKDSDTDWSNITTCITTTLYAVRSELDLLHLTASMREADSVSYRHSITSLPAAGKSSPNPSVRSRPRSASMVEHPHTLHKAKKIVDCLIQRLHIDTEDNKVEFRVTPDRRLSVTDGGMASDTDTDTKLKQKPNSSVWTASTIYALHDAILQTFRDVLFDMHGQNQYFNPDSSEQQVSDAPESMVLPSLPFLLDEFILSNLQNISSLMTNNVPGEEANVMSLTMEAMLVAGAFHGVLRKMLSEKVAGTCKDAAEAEQEGRRQIVLSVLDKAFKRVIEEAFESPNEDLVTIEEGSMSISRKYSDEDKKRSESFTVSASGSRRTSQVKGDLGKLLSSIKDVNEAARLRSSSRETMTSDEVREKSDMVLQATNQILTHVQDNLVPEDVFRDLCKTLLKNIPELDTLEAKRQRLIEELSELSEAITDGRIPHSQLEQAAVGLSFLERRNDPHVLAQVVKKVSATGSGFGPECLKVAVADLLQGFMTKSSGTNQDPSTLVPAGEESEERRSIPLTKESSINARTISKTNIMDDRENRSDSVKSVYSTHLLIQKNEIGVHKDQSIISEGIEPTSRSDHSMFNPQEGERAQEISSSSSTFDGRILGKGSTEEFGESRIRSDSLTEDEAKRLTDDGMIRRSSMSMSGEYFTPIAEEPITEVSPVPDETREKETPNVEAEATGNTPTEEEEAPTEADVDELTEIEELPLATNNEQEKEAGADAADEEAAVVENNAVRGQDEDKEGDGWDDSGIGHTEDVNSSALNTVLHDTKGPATGTADDSGIERTLVSEADVELIQSKVAENADKMPGVGNTKEGGSAGGDTGGNERAEQEGANVQQTESQISKGSGSKASLEAANEDWNRSAVRGTRESYVSCIDAVRGCESPDSGVPAPILVQASQQHHQGESFAKTWCRPQTGKRCKSEMRGKYMPEMTVESPYNEFLRIPERAGAEKGGSNTAQGSRPKVRSKTKTRSSRSAHNNQVDWESAASVHQYLNRGQNGTIPDADLPHATLKMSHRSLKMSHRQERTKMDDMVSLKKSSSITLHRQFSLTLFKQSQEDKSAASSSSKDGAQKPIGGQDKVKASSGSAKKSSKKEAQLHPYLQTQEVLYPKFTNRGFTSKEERVQQKAFTTGFNILNLKERERIRQKQKERDMRKFCKAVATAFEDKHSETTAPPTQLPAHLQEERGESSLPCGKMVHRSPPESRTRQEPARSVNEILQGPSTPKNSTSSYPADNDSQLKARKGAPSTMKGDVAFPADVQVCPRPAEADRVGAWGKKTPDKSTVCKRVRLQSPPEFFHERRSETRRVHSKSPAGKSPEVRAAKEPFEKERISLSTGRVLQRPLSRTNRLAKDEQRQEKQSCQNPSVEARSAALADARHRKTNFPILSAHHVRNKTTAPGNSIVQFSDTENTSSTGLLSRRSSSVLGQAGALSPVGVGSSRRRSSSGQTSALGYPSSLIRSSAVEGSSDRGQSGVVGSSGTGLMSILRQSSGDRQSSKPSLAFAVEESPALDQSGQSRVPQPPGDKPHRLFRGAQQSRRGVRSTTSSECRVASTLQGTPRARSSSSGKLTARSTTPSEVKRRSTTPCEARNRPTSKASRHSTTPSKATGLPSTLHDSRVRSTMPREDNVRSTVNPKVQFKACSTEPEGSRLDTQTLKPKQRTSSRRGVRLLCKDEIMSTVFPGTNNPRPPASEYQVK